MSRVLVGADRDIGGDSIARSEHRPDPALEGCQLELPGAPPCLRRWQVVIVLPEPEIEVPMGVQAQDRLAKEALQPPEKLIDFGKLLPVSVKKYSTSSSG
jgi:hypothetical protein